MTQTTPKVSEAGGKNYIVKALSKKRTQSNEAAVLISSRDSGRLAGAGKNSIV